MAMTLSALCKWGSERLWDLSSITLWWLRRYCSDLPSREPAARRVAGHLPAAHPWNPQQHPSLRPHPPRAAPRQWLRMLPKREGRGGEGKMGHSSPKQILWWAIYALGVHIAQMRFSQSCTEVWSFSYPILPRPCCPFLVLRLVLSLKVLPT